MSTLTHGEFTSLESGVDFKEPDHITYWFGSAFDVFIHYTRDEQVQHAHLFDIIGKDGVGSCSECGVTAWASAWVKTGLYDTQTHHWMAEQDRANRALVEATGFEKVNAILDNHSKVIAEIDLDKPARVNGRHRKEV